MKKTAVVSAFRNSPLPQIKRWVEQIVGLNFHRPARAVAIVGDLAPGDRTVEYLIGTCHNHGVHLSIFTFNHGGEHFGSVDHPTRMFNLSRLGDAMLDNLCAQEAGDEMIFFVESDLIWLGAVAHSLLNLAADHEHTGFDIVSPLVFAGEHFYDVWGFRALDGSQFAPFPPYHSELAHFNGTLHEVGSIGSCYAARIEVAQQVRYGDNAFVSWSANARAAGFRLGVAPNLRIDHPA